MTLMMIMLLIILMKVDDDVDVDVDVDVEVQVDIDGRMIAGEPGFLRGQSKSGEQKVDPGGKLKMQRRKQFSIKLKQLRSHSLKYTLSNCLTCTILYKSL